MARDLEVTGTIERRTAPLLKDVIEAFLSDARARGLRDSSIYKLKLLTTRLQTFADSKGYNFISDFNVERTAAFRETWTNRGTAARKKLEALRTFFEPFTPEEISKIIKAIDSYPDRENAIRLRGLILLLRYSGLRLGDAATISRDRIENGTLVLRTEKTGTKVRVPLPAEVIDAIKACPGARYPF